MAGRRVSPAELLALQSEQERIRNVCIIAHVDHGKTTLSDSLVSSNGIISAKLAGKLRFLDSTEEEQQRGITMKSSAISLLHSKEDRKGRMRQQQAEGQGATPLPTPPPTDPSQPPPPPTPAQEATPPPADPTQPPTPPTAAQEAAQPAGPVEGVVREYLINLIDSPGHIDFSSDVSTATRLSDGAIVVVDVLEGVCTQTHAVLRQAWAERMKPCLVLNKLDRLILELRLTPMEAWWHLQRVLERLNAICSSLITSETFRLDETEAFADGLEKEWLFSPERGNVVFASSLYCWAFSVSTFAKIWAQKLGLKRVVLQRHLWGDFIFNPKTSSVTRWSAESKAKPMFVSMILDPIWQVYDAAVVTPDPDKLAKMIKRLDLEVPPRELSTKDSRSLAQAVFRRWLPLSDAVLDMVVDMVPGPIEAQRRRIGALWPGHREIDPDDTLPPPTSTSTPPSTSNGASSSSSPQKPNGSASSLCSDMARVRAHLSRCANNEDAPVVVYVSKMVAVRNAELVDMLASSSHSPALPLDGESFVGFARVFSGVLKPNARLHVLGPKYHPQRRRSAAHAKALTPDADPENPDETAEKPRLGLYMMMGTSLHPVPHMPAGNLVAILGLEGHVLKCATLADTLACPALTPMTLQAKPIVRVAVEVVRQQDMAALEKGLAKLYMADPAVEVSVQETGEHVIMALGELHLEQCLKDLRERYARVELRASAPLVTFKESVSTDAPLAPLPVTQVKGGYKGQQGEESSDRPPQLTLPPWSEEEGAATSAGGVCVLETVSKDCRVTLRCLPLPDDLAKLLEAEPSEVRSLLTSLGAEREAARSSTPLPLPDTPLPTEDEEEEDGLTARGNSRRLSVLSADGGPVALPFRQQVEEEWARAFETAANGSAMHGLAANGLASVLAFGPRNSGPNALVRRPGMKVRLLTVEKRGEEGEEEEEREAFSPGSVEGERLRERVWRALENSVVTGFQMATASGPLAEEQLYGVCFVLESVSLLLREGQRPVEFNAPAEGTQPPSEEEKEKALGDWLMSRLGFLTGQVMSTCKSACRAAFLSAPVRLVEALFKCDLQCDRVQLGKLYGVLSRRRGRVVEEDMIEGTDLFLIKALLPVAESFGFATELLKKTSGAATSPQLSFSHWERMETDPFWRPRNEEDREEFGEVTYDLNISRKYIDDTRRRKGLQLGEKIVIHAEKQRTLKKNK